MNAAEGYSEVVSVSVEDTPLDAYNLEVETFHTFFVAAPANDNAPAVWVHNAGCWSEGRQILEGMAAADKRGGVARADVDAYRDLNKTLPDPISGNKIRVDEGHASSPHPVIQQPHAHIGNTHHIPITDP